MELLNSSSRFGRNCSPSRSTLPAPTFPSLTQVLPIVQAYSTQAQRVWMGMATTWVQRRTAVRLYLGVTTQNFASLRWRQFYAILFYIVKITQVPSFRPPSRARMPKVCNLFRSLSIVRCDTPVFCAIFCEVRVSSSAIMNSIFS